MTGKFQPGDHIKFKYGASYGWKGVVATITSVSKTEDGQVVINYKCHSYNGRTTADRVIPCLPPLSLEEEPYAGDFKN